MTARPMSYGIPAAYRRAFADGMERGGRICSNDHAEMRAAARRDGAWIALLLALGLAIVAAWLGRGR